jgi:hypothetical protein
MRCLSCNRRLNDKEATRKYSSSGTFVDLCDSCFGYIEDEVPVVDIAYDPSIDDTELDENNELYSIDGELNRNKFDEE